MKAQTKNEYKTAWNNHIDILNSVAFDLMANKEGEELQKIMLRLKEIVEVASHNIDFDN